MLFRSELWDGGGYTDWIRSVICVRNRVGTGKNVEEEKEEEECDGGWRVMVVEGSDDDSSLMLCRRM